MTQMTLPGVDVPIPAPIFYGIPGDLAIYLFPSGNYNLVTVIHIFPKNKVYVAYDSINWPEVFTERVVNRGQLYLPGDGFHFIPSGMELEALSEDWFFNEGTWSRNFIRGNRIFSQYNTIVGRRSNDSPHARR